MSSTTPTTSHAQPSQTGTPARSGVTLPGRLGALLVVIAAALYLLPINAFTNSYDEGVYWQSLRAMAAGHPLFSSVFSSQPPFFLLSLYPFYMGFGQSIAAARIGVAIFAIIGVIAIYWLASELAGPWAGVIAAALLLIDPHYLAQAHTLEAEGPAVALEILAVALAVAAMRRAGRTRHILAALSGVVIALGTLTKLLDVVAIVPAALYLATPFFAIFNAGEGRLACPTPASRRQGLRATLPGLGFFAAGGILTTLIILAPFAGSFGAMWDQVVTFHLVAAHHSHATLTGNIATTLGGFNLLWLPAALALGIAIWRRDWRMAIPTIWLIFSVAILVRQAPLFDHHVVIIAPCLAVMASLIPAMLAPVVGDIRGRWLGVAAVVIVAGIFVYGAARGARLDLQESAIPHGSELQAAAAIQTFTTPGEVIVTDNQYIAAYTDHSTPPDLVDTSFVRIDTRYLTATQLENIITRDNIRVIVFDTGRFQTIPDFMPWLNAHYEKIADLGSGRAVYVRTAPGSGIA